MVVKLHSLFGNDELGLTDLSVEELNGRRAVVLRHLEEKLKGLAGGVGVGGMGEGVARRLADQRLDALNAEEELERSFVRELEREKEKERKGGRGGKKKFVGAVKTGFVDCGVSTTGFFFFFPYNYFNSSF